MPSEKLENYDRIILKNLPGAIIALVLMISGQGIPGVRGSILDSADIVVAEVEPGEPGGVQNLNEYFAQTKAVGIEGSLSDTNDSDSYRFSVGKEWSMALLFEIQAAEDKTITTVAAGVDSHVYFVSENNIWRHSLEGQNESAEVVISSPSIAQRLELDPQMQIHINTITGVPTPDAQEILIFALGGDASIGGGSVMALDRNDELIIIATRDEITAVTGELQVNLAAAAADEEGRIYLTEQVSNSVLQIEREPLMAPPVYLVSVYTDADVLQEAVEAELFEDLAREISTMPRTVIAETTGVFMVNSLVLGSGNYAAPGYHAYYLTQLGPAFGGSGVITRILVNQNDADEIIFDVFFAPEGGEWESLNPSALALDTSTEEAFGRGLFMGTFGPSLGDDFDGKVFIVNSYGEITPFVTSYEDEGAAAMKNGQEVMGFFDVVDMAFPPTMDGPFGPYLYVLSENIDQNGPEEGGFSSDLWRINQEGEAELFVESIADGVISLAFGNFAYGNDLFVATFNSGVSEGKVLRVDSEGNVETFFDFNPFGSSISVCDLAFAPVLLPGDSPMAGALVLTMQSGAATFVVQLEPDGVTYEVWATNLETGDVSSGDLIFAAYGNLIVAQQDQKNLVQLDYRGLFDYTLGQLQVRPMLDEGLEEIRFVPYALLEVADQPRILRLSDSGDPADIATEVSPSVLDVGEVPDDGSMEISFVFDAAGDLFTYIQNVDELRTSRRNQEGKFSQFTTRLTGAKIDAFADLVDARLPQLAWSADGSLVAIGMNGAEAPAGQEPPSQEFDDVVLWVGNTIDGEYEPNALVHVHDLTQMRLELTGPGEGEFYEFIAGVDSVLDETLEALTGGSYNLSIGSVQNNSGEYQVVIILDNSISDELICDESTGSWVATNHDGERLILTHSGPGQSELKYEHEPNGIVLELTSLTITGSKGSTSVSLVNLDDPEDIILEELVLTGSLGQLEYKGTLNLLRGDDFTKGTVKYVDLGTVRDVSAAKYTFPEFRATNLGDPETENHQFLAKKITRLMVENNVENINVLEFSSRNAYRLIDIGGIVDKGICFGLNISECIVRNVQNEELAMNESYLACSPSGGAIGNVRIEQGDLYQTGIFADKNIELVELCNGNLDTSTVESTGKKSNVDTVIVRRVDDLSDPNERNGNIISSRIAADRSVHRVHADEDIDDNTAIRTNGSVRTQINTVTCRGDCSASFSSIKIEEILVGFDENKQKRPETDDFTGGNFSGSVSVSLSLDLLSATGSIENAYVGANRAYGYGTINSIFAEDGFINSTVSCYKKITRIMIGYENGKRNRIVNTAADVSGAISGPRLGRLYYTGENTANLSVSHLGPVIDDVPGN